MTGGKKENDKMRSKKRAGFRLPQSRAGEQGLYLNSLYHLGRSSQAKDRKKPKKNKV